jgi:hypothetical protein
MRLLRHTSMPRALAMTTCLAVAAASYGCGSFKSEGEIAADQIGDVDLALDARDWNVSSLKAVLHGDRGRCVQTQNRLHCSNIQVSAGLSIGMGVTSVDIGKPFKGSIHGIHVGDASSVAWSAAQQLGAQQDTVYRSFSWGPIVRCGLLSHPEWEIHWFEDKDHRITTLVMMDRKYEPLGSCAQGL